jgi:uncharacterized repeat protein (TIGR04138 family)
MTTTAKSQKYHPQAYRFIFPALKYSQDLFRRPSAPGMKISEAEAHISGQELVHGIRLYAQEQFGLLARLVFNRWGIHTTEDFGKIVFELIEQGEMKKTEDDSLGDFCDVYDFEEVFDGQYIVDVSRAFSPR